MKRLLSTMRWDIVRQYRNGFYHATAFVVGMWLLLYGRFPAAALGWLFPLLVLSNLSVTAFYFIGGLILLEKGEGTLEVQIVTPLRSGEYLASKALTLGLLSLLENGIVIGWLYGARCNWIALILAVALGAALYAFFGFYAVVRYDSINAYLMPSVLYLLLLSAPLLPYFGMGESGWFYWHPIQAILTLLTGVFRPIPALQFAYGILYATFCAALLGYASRNAFRRFIVLKEGVRP